MRNALARLLAALVLAVVGTAPNPVAAQSQRIFARYGIGFFAELGSTPESFGLVLRTRSVPPAPTQIGYTSAVVAGAGRYFLWGTSDFFAGSAVVVLDTVAGDVSTHPVSREIGWVQSMIGVDDEGEDVILALLRPEMGISVGVWSMSQRSVTRVIAVPGTHDTSHFAYAPGARRVIMLRPTGSICSPYLVDVVDLDTGTVQDAMVEMPFVRQWIATNRSATRLWVANGYPQVCAPAGYAVFDLESGALLAFNTSVQPEPLSARSLGRLPPLVVDDERQLVLAVTEQGAVALDGETLRVLGTADAPRYRTGDEPLPPGAWVSYFPQLLAHPDAAAVFAFEWGGYGVVSGEGACLQSAMVALDSRTGARLAARNLTDATGQPACGIEVTMAVAPRRPGQVEALVAGRNVVLSWERSSQATHYQVAVGTTAGADGIGIFVANGVTREFDDVPPGTYHVRVRAVNYAGASAFSEDLVVVVSGDGDDRR